MKICYNSNKIEEIKLIVQSKAKFQKVMLIFDDFVSNLEVTEIYNSIKDLCIYNQSNINNVDPQELNNGYRLVIYVCCTDSYLSSKFEKGEFINIFCPKDTGVLPFFLSNNNTIDCDNNYLLLDSTKVDVGMMGSVCFNQFFNYFKNLMSLENKEMDFSFITQEVTQHNLLSCMQKVDEDVEFLDINILKKTNLSYEKIVLVDLLLINAFLVLIMSIKSQSLVLVDVYKSAKESNELIEKFYAMYNNEAFISLIMLNYNCLFNYCEKTKQKILDYLNVFNFTQTDVEETLGSIKEYAKHDQGLVSYLYLFDIFGV